MNPVFFSFGWFPGVWILFKTFAMFWILCFFGGVILRRLNFISNFRHVLNPVFFLLGDSPASEFYFKLSPCSESRIFSFGWFPGVWILFQTFAMFWILYFFFWAIPRRLNFISNFRHVLNPVFFLLGESPASEFYFKISLFWILYLFSFGWFPGFWILYPDVSEHCYIFIGGVSTACENWTVFRSVRTFNAEAGGSPKRETKNLRVPG